MIFTGPRWWAGLMQLGIFAAELVLLFAVLRRCHRLNRAAVFLVGVYFLAYKLWEYISNRKWPIDFSALSYFLFGIAAVLPFRPLKTAASFSGFLAGGIFIVSYIVFPEFHAQTNPIFYYRAMGFFNHNLLFTMSFAMLFQYRFRPSHIVWIAGWIAAVVIYSEVMINVLHVVDTVEVLTKIIDGTILSNLFPGFTPAWWSVGLYYILCSGLLCFFIWLVYRLNRVFRRPCGAEEGA